MKVKTLVVFASAAALPMAAAFAQNAEPSGPQGTGWYGYSGPRLATLDRNGDGVISADEYAAANLPVERRAPAYGAPSAGATTPPQYDRNADLRRERRGRFAYDGFSADTNPPVPPQ